MYVCMYVAKVRDKWKGMWPGKDISLNELVNSHSGCGQLWNYERAKICPGFKSFKSLKVQKIKRWDGSHWGLKQRLCGVCTLCFCWSCLCSELYVGLLANLSSLKIKFVPWSC